MTSLWLCLIICLALAWETRQAPANPNIQDSITATTTTTTKNAEITQEADAREKRNIEVPPPEILRFMRRFGYLETNPSDSESLYHESAIVEAIKNVQKYGALNQTGELDNQTLELFNKPRCGVPDIEGTPYYLTSSTQRAYVQNIRDRRSESRAGSDFRVRGKRFVVGARTWKKRRIRYFISNWSRKIPKSQVERDIARALELWARYSGLHFVRVNDTDADIILYFGTRYHGDNFSFDGPGNILAHAFYPYEMGSWGGDVHFDEDENWKENSTDLATGVDFYAVAAHEIGHSLGLAHSPHYNSIMFPYYKGPGAGTTLDYDDTLAMYTIYLTKVLEDDENIVTIPEEPQITLTTPTFPVEKEKISKQTTKSTLPSFHDDYETVKQHKSRFASNTTKLTELSTSNTDIPPPIPTLPTLWPKPELSKIPNICLGQFDAVSVLNGTVHVFKNEYVYKLTPRYTVMNGYPLSIYEMFPFLPADVKRIDAAYERYDCAGVFFTGDKYWVFSYAHGKRPILIENSPLPIENLIGYATHIDAVMLWPKNNLTYIFAGEKFWRYNDRLQTLDVGYPKPMRRWPGIPEHIDAAATLNNGKTYFFKNNLYWLYDNANIRPMRGYPRRASNAWLHCVTTTRKPLRNYNTTVTFIAPSALT
ncbi:PREDICTED: matrix metalloproteinase-14-like [Bactrocera latifrons]|uniref:matrix metalloproteinase-14-like n=1 Tax=Bactrocera latifrons TaxID=174628 RepID=UPI0008DE34F7|nr:PREDICTED: matrix metalloproteinase-14-like [Bactrocera latifrons]